MVSLMVMHRRCVSHQQRLGSLRPLVDKGKNHKEHKNNLRIHRTLTPVLLPVFILICLFFK